MAGYFLLLRPIARRPAQESRSAARGVSTGVTSRGTPGRARQVGQAFAAHEPRPSDPGLVLASWVKGLSHSRSKDTPAVLSESTLEEVGQQLRGLLQDPIKAGEVGEGGEVGLQGGLGGQGGLLMPLL